ncbi:CCC motif membrane protein [Formosa sp. S-31]|uniref:CCC motif membrane protein n=1 Tax=Formosa sp. S-31 TaxID=2790949 RepID=UPI003EB7320D
MEKIKLNSNVVYILSALGLLCCCFAGFGVIPSGIAYYIAQTKLKEAELNPENYDNIQGMNTAKTVALVIAVINIMYLLYTAYQIYTVGWDNIMIQSEEMMEQWNMQQPV